MEKFTIKKNEALQKLAKVTGKEPDDLINHIMQQVEKIDDIDDLEEHAGLPIFELFNMYLYENKTVVTLYLLGKATKELTEIMEGIKTWGTANECPVCGCELYTNGEYITDWDDGHKEAIWEETYCSNPNCEYHTECEDC